MLQEILEKIKKEATFQSLHKITSERCQYQTKKFQANLLLVAVRGKYFNEVLEGLSSVKNVNQADATFGFTLLHCASRDNQIDLVKKLLEKGANVNAENCDGWTALHLAAEQGHIAILNLFIQHLETKDSTLLNTFINQADKQGITPLHIAVCNNHIISCQALLEQGADINQVNKNGMSSLHWACQNGHINLVKLLLTHNANVTQKVITDQKTLYEIGIEKNIESRVESFVSAQNRKNYFRSFFTTIKFQFTPVELAELMGHEKIVKLITQWNNTPAKISSFTI